ncbi:hypothetical protein [Sphingobacterium multivorum]|uniref:hypothetical protein n=1 Tax=Sphingobacterium multivorum TaxID=28454 RepID=UPI0028ABFF2C|nr:hypothetical protein [Sphingobacterium multivorum]
MHKEFEKIILRIKAHKILSQEQLNNIYLVSCLKDIQSNKDYDFNDSYEPVKQYVSDLIEVLQMKEEYELCDALNTLLKKL